MNINKLCKHISTLGPIGYMKAPGTVGAFFSLLFAYYLQKLAPFLIIQLFIIIIITGITILFILPRALRQFKDHDPKHIVIDESIGCLIATIAVPWNISSITGCFLLFRFFDITKICGIAYLERIFPSALGVVLDDIVAGILANLFVRLLIL